MRKVEVPENYDHFVISSLVLALSLIILYCPRKKSDTCTKKSNINSYTQGKRLEIHIIIWYAWCWMPVVEPGSQGSFSSKNSANCTKWD